MRLILNEELAFVSGAGIMDADGQRDANAAHGGVGLIDMDECSATSTQSPGNIGKIGGGVGGTIGAWLLDKALDAAAEAGKKAAGAIQKAYYDYQGNQQSSERQENGGALTDYEKDQLAEKNGYRGGV